MGTIVEYWHGRNGKKILNSSDFEAKKSILHHKIRKIFRNTSHLHHKPCTQMHSHNRIEKLGRAAHRSVRVSRGMSHSNTSILQHYNKLSHVLLSVETCFNNAARSSIEYYIIYNSWHQNNQKD